MQITDTLKTSNELRSAGFTNRQADALASQQESTARELVEHIRQAFAADFQGIRTDIQATARDQLKWTITATAAIVGLGVALLALLMRFLTA